MDGVSGLTDADLVKIKATIFEAWDELLKMRGFGYGEEEDKATQQEYDALCARTYRWYLRAQKRLGNRIQAHFMATREWGPLMKGPPRLFVHVFPYRYFPTREDAKQHSGYLSLDCPCSILEDHGDAGVVIIHNPAPEGSRVG
jgi:hypothetical protein